jgi:hypothetical protein
MPKENELKLGQKARDIVTGIEGIIIGKTEWLTGCNTYGIKPPVKEDGTNLEAIWVDEIRIEIVDPVSIFDKKKQQQSKDDAGGPQPTPRQHSD